MKALFRVFLLAIYLAFFISAAAQAEVNRDYIYNMGELEPNNSKLNLKVGDKAIDFTLPSVSGGEVSLSQYFGKDNVVLAFIPAAWTPVCSNQINDYTYLEDVFVENNAVLLAISTDNIPTLHAWTRQLLNVWFPVLSDFSPQGAVAKKYGVLRPEGIPERAIFVIDKNGRIVFIDVHDINTKPETREVIEALVELGVSQGPKL